MFVGNFFIKHIKTMESESMRQEENYPVDIVIPWVNGNDPEWLEEKQKYQKEITSSVHSFDYQDWGILKYWFRGVEKNMPWIRHIYFVTWGHLPDWLNTAHPKLVVVKHEDYLPKEYLPTFSANPIEINFHRIDGLAEHFIYFNDDMFVIDRTTKQDFFRHGLPCECAIINPIAPANNNCIAHMQLSNAAVINQHFKKHEVIINNPLKWFNLKYGKLLPLNILFIPWGRFPGLLEKHLPASLLKSTYDEIWEKEYELMDQTSRHRFRDFKLDVNQWLIKEWQIASGNFWPRSIAIGKNIPIRDKDTAISAAKIIKNKKYKLICVNDHVENKDPSDLIKIVNEAFEVLYPNKSEFEK